MKSLFLFFFLLSSTTAFAQIGVAYHHGALPFAEFNYDINNRFRPHLRIGTDSYLEDVTFELGCAYNLSNKDDYEVYTGLGLMASYEGLNLVVPIGLNLYPLSNKQFGFQMEITPLLGGSGNILRGTLGLRYRFGER